MVARAHYQDHWVLNLYRATQAAIGQQLKIEYEPPRELTAELTIILRSWTSRGMKENEAALVIPASWSLLPRAAGSLPDGALSSCGREI